MRVIETKGFVQQMEYTPDGRYLVFVERWENDWLVRWFDLISLAGTCAAEYGRLWGVWLALAANRFVTVGWGEGFTVWEFANGRIEKIKSVSHEPAWSVKDVSQDARHIAYFQGYGNSRDRNRIIIREIKNEQPCTTFRTLEDIHLIRFSKDGAHLASATARELTVWSLEKIESVATWKLPRKKRNSRAPSRIQSVTMTPDSRSLFIRGNGRLYLWEAAADVVRLELPLALDVGFALSCSWDNRLFALASSPMENEVQLWDMNNVRPIKAFQWPLYTSRCIAFAPDGATIAASSENRVVIWDLDHV